MLAVAAKTTRKSGLYIIRVLRKMSQCRQLSENEDSRAWLWALAQRVCKKLGKHGQHHRQVRDVI